jgi:hypothetical protein
MLHTMRREHSGAIDRNQFNFLFESPDYLGCSMQRCLSADEVEFPISRIVYPLPTTPVLPEPVPRYP